MKVVRIPYDMGSLTAHIEEEDLAGVLSPHIPDPSESPQALTEAALEAPIASPKLEELCRGKRHIVLLVSDHTRPVPSSVFFPALYRRIRAGAPRARLTLLAATGCHRAMTEDEIYAKFGGPLPQDAEFVCHNAGDRDQMEELGTLPSGGKLLINRLAAEADLLLAEGFIEPHFFAGFSGGRKSVLPGVCSVETVFYNHNADFIANPYARAGILDGNPIHEDMLYAAGKAKLAFILNAALGKDHRLAAAFAGDPVAAHREGCAFVAGLAGAYAPEADVVLTGNGGYPLDQNLYQAVKSASTAEACVKQGGSIIVCSGCRDGHGGENFVRWFTQYSPEEAYRRILSVPREETPQDLWQAQILARILLHARVCLVSDPALKETALSMGLHWEPDADSALLWAYGRGRGRKTLVIPDGVGLYIRKETVEA